MHMDSCAEHAVIADYRQRKPLLMLLTTNGWHGSSYRTVAYEYVGFSGCTAFSDRFNSARVTARATTCVVHTKSGAEKSIDLIIRYVIAAAVHVYKFNTGTRTHRAARSGFERVLPVHT